MNTLTVIGAPGMGKSPFVKSFINGRACLVWDIQDEYGTRKKYEDSPEIPLNLPTDTRLTRSRYIGTEPEKFLAIAATKRNTIIVFEEATAFFEGKAKKELKRFLANRYHSKNPSLFLFHSIQLVPPTLFAMSNYVVLFKTLDIESAVFKKAPRLLEPYKQLQFQPNGSKKIIQLI